MKFTTDTVLPTTMIGSYPRPGWFTQQLDGRDIRVAFKNVAHAEAYDDATRLAIQVPQPAITRTRSPCSSWSGGRTGPRSVQGVRADDE